LLNIYEFESTIIVSVAEDKMVDNSRVIEARLHILNADKNAQLNFKEANYQWS
jgi:hypothetical protein